MTTTERPLAPWEDYPRDLGEIEWKALPSTQAVSPLTGVIGHDDSDGTITALVAISGVPDEVGDVIVPGSLDKAIKRLRPKGVASHNWGAKTSKLVWALELMPGDERLPRETPQGEPWPAAAGGLLIKAQYNLDKEIGRDAYADAKFYGPEECFSIGYKVRPGGAKMRQGKRYLFDYDVFEWSQVLHGAHKLAHLTGVKSLTATWYGESRSGDTDEGTTVPDGVELKVRVVRDSQFWGLPFGTPIKPGMKPKGHNRAATADEIASTTTQHTDQTPETPATPGATPAPGITHDPDDPAGTPGAAPPGPDPTAALDALRQRQEQMRATPVGGVMAATLDAFLRPGANVRASADGQLIAVNDGASWRIADTANGGVMPAIPGDLPPGSVDHVLEQLAGVGIPWGDVEARRARWADPVELAADKARVQAILTQAGVPLTPDAPDGSLDAPNGTPAVPGQPPAATGAPETSREAGGTSPAPQAAAPPLAGEAPPTVPPAKPAHKPARGSVKGHGVKVGDRIKVHDHPKGTLEGTLAQEGHGYSVAHDDGSKTWLGGTGSKHRIEKLKATEKPAEPAKPELYQPTGNMGAPDKLTDEQLDIEHTHAAAKLRAAHEAGIPRNTTAYSDHKLAEKVFGDEKRRRAAKAKPEADKPTPEKPTAPPPGAVPIPEQQLAAADRVRNEALGIEEGPDGEIEVTEAVAARQDRLTELLKDGDGEDRFAGFSDDELKTTRRDLVSELALQDELARRDAVRKRDAAAARVPDGDVAATDSPSGDSASPVEPAAPKVRPGLAGAAEDLGDLLNAKPRDDAAVRTAAERLAKLLRRAPEGSKAFEDIHAAIGDGDIHAAIESGQLKAGMLFSAAAALREERRVQRNTTAKARRKAKRIERDRIRSAIADVDGHLRTRGLNPEDYGGAVDGLPVAGEQAGSSASTTAPPTPEQIIDESGRPSSQDAHLDARTDAIDAVHSGHRLKLRKALKEMGVDGDPEQRHELERRLLDAPDDDAVEKILKEIDAKRDSGTDWRLTKPDSSQGAQSPQTEGGGDGSPRATGGAVLPGEPAGPVRPDQEQTGVLRGAGGPRPGADNATDRRPGRTRPAGGDLSGEAGPDHRGADRGDRRSGAGIPAGTPTTEPAGADERPTDTGDTGPEHAPSGDAGGPGTGGGAEGVQRRPGRTGSPEPADQASGDADTAAPAQPVTTADREAAVPGTDGEPVAEGALELPAEQPTADSAQLDAIPDTGTRFHPVNSDDFAPAGKKSKLAANLAALHVLRQLQDEHRPATEDEQRTLAKWAGWGGLPEVFDDNKPEYATQREELRGLLSDTEWNEAKRNTLNAHYTSPDVVRDVWKAVQDLGFDGGRVLEPGSGSGTFIGFAPENADMVGVELDSTTAAISRALYPDATIRNESFADTRIPTGSFDASIGNVPFGDFALQDRVHNPGRAESIHNHFILKSLALTKPGGVCAVLTSRFTLDAQGEGARKKMAEMGDLLGAVRLPTGSHSKISGTDVIEDILIFRRREPGAEPLTDQDWVSAPKRDIDGQNIPFSDYFTHHPEQVLGEVHAEPGQYGSGSLIVRGDKTLADLPAALGRIVENAKAHGIELTPRLEDLHELAGPGTERHDGHIAAEPDGTFTKALGGAAVPHPVPEKQAEELRALIGLRDTLQELLSAESASVSNSPRIRELRKSLNDQYDAYTGRYGPINRYTLSKTGARVTPGQGGFRTDPMSAIVRALEVYDPETGTAAKTDIFRKRSVSPREIPTHADTAEDALALCMDTFGEVRLTEIAKLLGTDTTTARESLGDLVYEQPPLSTAEQNAAWTEHLESQSAIPGQNISADQVDLSSVGESVRAAGRLEPAAAYLSGNVRRKLAAARAAAVHDKRFDANVAALEKVIPTDLGTDEVDGRLGAAWIPADDVKRFLVDLLYDGKDGGSIQVASSGGGIWTVEGGQYGTKAREEWGTDRMSAGEIVQHLLEQKSIRIEDTIDKKRYPNVEATTAAQAKAEELAERFSEWLWEDPERTKRLLAAYNNQFNAIRLRSYDNMPRVFPGMADDFKPRAHQVAAVNRMVEEPTALLGHVVGAGKTAEMAMGTRELKRLGLVNKPAIVVPNHMLEQFSREYLQIYPNAKVLAAGTDDLKGDKRREFVARAATGDWDCVILSQNAMQLIPMSRESMEAYIDRELSALTAQLEQAKRDAAGDSAKEQTVKKMEKAKIKAEEALKAKLDKNKDAGVSFEQTGIDYVCVDEAHMYSNLRTLSNIQGASATGSDMATDLHMKLEHLRANNPSGRVATFATGTPIRNTVTQAYIMQRYMRPDLLEEAGIFSFDQWAATFGKVVDEMELKPEGTGFRMSSRFAKFRNVPELLRLFHVFADIKTAKDLDLPTPKLKGGAVRNVVVPGTDELRALLTDLGRRADLIRGGHPEKRPAAGGGEDVEDNMLLVSGDGRKAALRMSSKVDMVSEEITRIWKETKDRPVPKDLNDPAGGDDPPPGGMQIVFCDLYTPGGKGDWNAYDALRDKLVASGMDPTGIRFMHEAKNDREKAELFAAARNGQVQVLIGSTEKMGVGTNVQRRAVALHHLDCPWRPSDLEQRNGRILRQGNSNDEVEVIRYVTEGSFDAYMWQTVERKQKFIDQIMRGELGDIREIEDVGDTALSYAEVKALATGNPMLMEKAKVDTVVGKLTRLERQHGRTQTNLRNSVPAYRANAAESEAIAAQLDAAAVKRTDTMGEKFTITTGGRPYTSRTEAATVLRDSIRRAIREDYYSRSGDPHPVASFGGHTLMATGEKFVDKYGRTRQGVKLSWEGLPGTIQFINPDDLENLGPGVFQTLRNNLDGFESRAVIMRERAASFNQEADTMEARIGVPFQHAEALKTAREESARLQAAMEAAGLSTDTGPSSGPSPNAALSKARAQATQRVTQMGRSEAGPEKDRLKRFSIPAASGPAWVSPNGAIAAMGTGEDFTVFMTKDGVTIRPPKMPGIVDDPAALLADLQASGLPYDQGNWHLQRRWEVPYTSEDYSLPYEKRLEARKIKQAAADRVREEDEALIRDIWAKHLRALPPKAPQTGPERAKDRAAAALKQYPGPDATATLKRFIKGGPRVPTAASDDGSVGMVTDTDGVSMFFATDNATVLNGPAAMHGPFDDPTAVANELAALGIPFGDKDALYEHWRDNDAREADLAKVREVYSRHTVAEVKALDAVIPAAELARLTALGVEVKAKRKPTDDADVTGQESYEDIVNADRQYSMTADGQLAKMDTCSSCGSDITIPAYSADGAPASCPVCGAVQKRRKVVMV